MPPLAQEQDTEARRLLSLLSAADERGAQRVYTSGSADLRQFTKPNDFARDVAWLHQRVGNVQTVTRTDVRVTRTMAADKTSQIYHVTGDRGQTDVKVYLTRQKGHWILDGLRLGELP